MEYSLTIFNSIFDNSTHRRMSFKTWDEFETLLQGLSQQPGYKPKKGERGKSSPLISPAVYKPGEKRRNVNVLGWGSWAALDIDDYECSFEEALQSFKGIRHICYSSASSTQENPKFRIVIPCDAYIPADKIKHFWFALNKEYNELGDPQTKDLSRMYYVPAQYPNSYQFIRFHRDAPFLNCDELLKKHPFAEPNSSSFKDKLSAEMQEKLLAYKKERLNNTSYQWSSYRDCPFVNQKHVSEYRCISETGWYAKMYSIMSSIAANAIKKGYPITPAEIESLAKEIDNETGEWYKNRPFKKEAARAIEWALQNS